MSTTIKYKGATLATVSNQTKTLLTSGTWLEDDIELTDVSGGGGASNIIEGTFTTQGTTGEYSIPLTYSGSGYPIVASVFIDGGVVNPNNTWYGTIQQYSIGEFIIIKNVINEAPQYTNSGSQCTVLAYRKSSASNATTFGVTSSNAATCYSSAGAIASATQAVKFKNATTLSYYVNTAGHGLMQNLKYRYIVMFSS